MSVVSAALGLRPDAVEAVLRSAIRAPSLHNEQPWRFRVTENLIELHQDQQRLCTAIDPDGRELRLGCGAALFNLRLALEHAGVRPLVTLLPEGTSSSLLAAVRGGGSTILSPEREALFHAIGARRTNRVPFLDDTVSTTHRQALIRAVQDERSWLHIVDDRNQLMAIRELLVRANRIQMADPVSRAELGEWPGLTIDEAIPVDAPEPLVVVLCSFNSGPLAEVQAGQALERMLLDGTALGLTASFLSPVVEVTSTRDDLRRMLGVSIVPQAVLRFGIAAHVPSTPRRLLAESLMGVLAGP